MSDIKIEPLTPMIGREVYPVMREVYPRLREVFAQPQWKNN